MKISVVIPSYGRAEDLDRCIFALSRQERSADQIILVLRPDDKRTIEVASKWSSSLPITVLSITVPGVVQALNAGLTAVNGEILTITDDDSEAHPDWLKRIEAHFEADPRLGGLGGRDIVHDHGVARIVSTKRTVGRILPFGRVVGEHDVGEGPARHVHHLKGVNMSWRMEAIGGKQFDTDFLGTGAQVSFELGFSLEVLSRDWHIVYDPEVKVNHFPGRRFGPEVRLGISVDVCEQHAFNFFLALVRYMQPGWRKKAALVWARVIGSNGYPGAIRGLIFRWKGNTEGLAKRQAVKRAWKTVQQFVVKQKGSSKRV